MTLQEDLSRRGEERGDEFSSVRPFVTVIMPVRNEAEFIVNSLRTVLSQDYPPNRIEVIVADGMSTDGTRDLVRGIEPHGPRLRLIDNYGMIVPTGLNVAISQARGDIIVRVDGHCEIATDYVSRCVDHLYKDDIGGVGGFMETVGQTAIAQVIAAGMASPFGVGGSAFRTARDRTMLVDTVAFPAYWRKIIESAGPFDEELVRNQDDEYNYRLRKMGVKILLAADIHSRYYSRASLRALWRQYFQYGYWKVRVMQKHPRQMRPLQFLPPLFVTMLVMSGLLALFVPLGRVLMALVAGSYMSANLAASVWTAHKNSLQLVIRLPLVFATLHVSYGLGFLVGLLRFWNRWGDRRTYVATLRSTSASDRP